MPGSAARRKARRWTEPADLRFKDPEPRIHPTAELKSCRLGRYAAIGERVVLREVTVGDFSYFERHAEAIYTAIGKFCSIAANTRINALEHPIERITQHKLSYRPNEYFRYLGVDADFRSGGAPSRSSSATMSGSATARSSCRALRSAMARWSAPMPW